MAGMSRRELEGFYLAHVHYVRGLLRRKSKRGRLQEADQEDVAQNVFRSVFTSWPSPQPLNERAYLTTIVANAVEAHRRRKNKVTCDQRLNVPMVAQEASGPIEMEIVDRVNLEDEVGMRRLRQNFEKIAQALQPKDAEVFRRMMIDVDDVPAKERNRVIAAVRKLMGVPVVPRSVEDPGEIVEGPSQCGRAVRRLEAEQRAANDELAEYEELDAAE